MRKQLARKADHRLDLHIPRLLGDRDRVVGRAFRLRDEGRKVRQDALALLCEHAVLPEYWSIT